MRFCSTIRIALSLLSSSLYLSDSHFQQMFALAHDSVSQQLLQQLIDLLDAFLSILANWHCVSFLNPLKCCNAAILKAYWEST